MSAVPLIYEYMFIYMTVTWIYMLGLPWWSVVENMYFQHQEAGGWGGQVGAGGGVQSLVGKLISHKLHVQNIYIYIYIKYLFKDGESTGSLWGQREDCAPVGSLLQNCHFQGHPTCSQVLLSHSLPLTWVTKNFPAPLWKPMVFTKTSQQSPNRRKLKQKENITSKCGHFCGPYHL